MAAVLCQLIQPAREPRRFWSQELGRLEGEKCSGGINEVLTDAIEEELAFL